MTKFVRPLMLSLIGLLPPQPASGWEVIDEDGWCCDDEGIAFYLNIGSFTSLRPDVFPNYYTVVDQLTLAASYWNHTGTEFNFYRGGDVVTCETSGDICMVEDDDPYLDGADALCHWSTTFCLLQGCWDWVVGIENYWIIFNAATSWRTRFGGSGAVDFYKVAAHEFGHALGLDHNDYEYEQIMMFPFTSNLRQITEDDAFGATFLYGRNEQRLRFRSARFRTDIGLTEWTGEQQEYDANHETYAQPYISQFEGSGTPFDFAVAWTRSDDRLVGVELIKMDSTSAHHIAQGPWFFAGATSWQGPSVAVGGAGRVGVAYRYEKENPNISDPIEMKRNGMIRIIMSNQDRSIWYNVEPGTCESSNVCRTLNTPVLSYSVAAKRWLLAFTEGPKDDNAVGHMHSVSVLISADSTGYYWSRPPLRVYDPANPNVFRHSTYIPPGFSCRDPQIQPQCLLAYASYDRTDGWIARIYQVGIGIGGTAPSGLFVLTGSNFEWGKSGFGNVNVAGAAGGWLMTRLDTPASPQYADDLTWSWRHWMRGIGGSWNGDGNQADMRSEKGFSVACKYFAAWGQEWCRFAWAEQ